MTPVAPITRTPTIFGAFASAVPAGGDEGGGTAGAGAGTGGSGVAGGGESEGGGAGNADWPRAAAAQKDKTTPAAAISTSRFKDQSTWITVSLSRVATESSSPSTLTEKLEIFSSRSTMSDSEIRSSTYF